MKKNAVKAVKAVDAIEAVKQDRKTARPQDSKTERRL